MLFPIFFAIETWVFNHSFIYSINYTEFTLRPCTGAEGRNQELKKSRYGL